MSAHAIPPLRLRQVDPLTDPSWAALLKHEAAGLFHSPPWLKAIAGTYGFPIRACIAANAAGRPVGGIAYCQLNDLAGHRIVSLPFSDNCDPLFPSLDVWQTMLAQLQASRIPIQLRCLMERRVMAGESISVAKRARWHRLPVTASNDEIWQQITPEARRGIRRAERLGVEVRGLSGDNDREAFYRMHVALRKSKYRLLAQPRKLFQTIEQRFEEIGCWHSLGAFLDGRMIAATVYLRWGDVLYYKFNASDQTELAARPNNLLVWKGIELARSLGCRVLDLGPSDDTQPGLIRFKRGFGAGELELCCLRWTPPEWRETTDTRHMLAEVTGLFTEPGVPDQVAMRAGELLYRYFA